MSRPSEQNDKRSSEIRSERFLHIFRNITRQDFVSAQLLMSYSSSVVNPLCHRTSGSATAPDILSSSGAPNKHMSRSYVQKSKISPLKRVKTRFFLFHWDFAGFAS